MSTGKLHSNGKFQIIIQAGISDSPILTPALMTLCYVMWGNDYPAGGSLALVHLGELGLTQQEHDLGNV